MIEQEVDVGEELSCRNGMIASAEGALLGYASKDPSPDKEEHLDQLFQGNSLSMTLPADFRVEGEERVL